ncbi:C-5 cytosine-specific DNA methylase [compost metagenome]
MLAMMEIWDSIESGVTDESYRNQITKGIVKKSKGQNIWDKSPWRSDENSAAPSLTSVTELIHPIHNRQWTIREYARLMGFPDDFIFYPEKSETEIIQTLAQGVPAQFIEYITSEIKEAINGERELIKNSNDAILSFQHHSKEKFKVFDINELLSLSEKEENGKCIGLEADKTYDDLLK